jgi:phosphoribosyl 1,2-cyclic phosphodiesterase
MTPAIAVEGKARVVIDCGTGGHSLAQKLITDDAKPLRGNILISHTHWDHIQGIPFFYPLFVCGNEWDIYGPKGVRESLREVLAGQMQYNYFPVTLDQCGAKIRFHDLVEGAFAIDDIKLSTRYLNHPALTLGYRLQVDGATVVYACDHEPHARMLALGDATVAGQDLRHSEFIEGAADFSQIILVFSLPLKLAQVLQAIVAGGTGPTCRSCALLLGRPLGPQALSPDRHRMA